MYWSSDWAWGVPLLMLTVVFHVCVFVLIVKTIVLKVHSERSARNLAHFFVAIASTALCRGGAAWSRGDGMGPSLRSAGRHVGCVQFHVVFAQRDHELRPF